MPKLLLIIFLIFCSAVVYAQQDMFVFKKRNTTLAMFSKGSYMAFLQKNNEWLAGYITKVQNDSFYLTPTAVIYGGGEIDTIRFKERRFALADVYAMPKDGLQIDYIDGRFQINTGGGHVHWYWIKGGWLFRAGAIGYVALNAANGLIKGNYSFSAANTGAAAAVYLFGEALYLAYSPAWRLHKKYHLQFIKISEQDKNNAAK